MNIKLFMSCLLITFGMLFWLLFHSGSIEFIIVRIIIAILAVLMLFFSINWNEKGEWKKTALVLAILFALGSVVFFILNLGIENYPRITLSGMAIVVVLGILYIKFFEPRLLRRKKFSQEEIARHN